ncbi:hypothetical protein [Eudoraea chungangensis]|uniref:hypothetical protein n=1 Tax=Eudoraea chungangensis TaxID=1481905 RepID=UPI0023EC6264|nr:hypothetical protein [Eudoraea chungangensis]
MKKFFGVAFLLLISCAEKVTQESLALLNGYWEIKEVRFPDGQTKEYEINPTVDYYFLRETTGYKKKVKPRMDGTFTITADSEEFEIHSSKEEFWISYSNNLSSREEQLIEISNNIMVLKDKDGLSYRYSRYNPDKTH